MAKLKPRIWVCDFETTTGAVSTSHTHVWCWAAISLDTNKDIVGQNIAQFIDFIQVACDKIYFHNLKFDGQFIIDFLLKNGWVYDDSDKPQPNSFSILRSSRGVMYSIDIRLKRRTIHIWDSLKKIPCSVDAMAKSYKIPMRKLKIDYDAFRSEHHELTDEEREYVLTDCRIVAEVLKFMLDQGKKKMTIGSDALEDWKSTVNIKKIKDILPQLSDEEDEFIRNAYKGGFTWVSPEYQNQDVGEGVVYDNNSMHPSQMYNKIMPYGKPEYFIGEGHENGMYPLFVQHLIISAKIKPKHIPCISSRKAFSTVDAEYLTEVSDMELYVTNIDLQLIKDQYDISYIEYIDGYYFKGIPDDKNIFRAFIDKWMQIKATSTGAIRQLAKLMLNNLYGKFGTRIHQFSSEPYLDENGVVKYRLSDKPSTAKAVYLPIAVFVTSYSRDTVIRAGQAVYDRLLYIDTDSLHLLGFSEPSNIDIDESAIGKWKEETKFVRARFLRPKRYIEETYTDEQCTDTYLKVTCGGMPVAVKQKVTWENFHAGTTYTGKLVPKAVNGGLILTETTFEMK